MIRLSRRQFGRQAGASLLLGLDAAVARGQLRPRVVVIGGGVGGVTVARSLARSIAVDVTLIERKPSYVTCFFINHFIAGLRPLASLTHGYGALGRLEGVDVLRDSVTAIDPTARHVVLQDGRPLPYDRLVLAPGVSFRFDRIEGLDAATSDAMPHAWDGGPQSDLLRRQVQSMEDGGVFVIAVPPAPFRCPVGPYERASLVAHSLKRTKPKSKVLILDAGDIFPYQDLFEDGWARHYPGMIEWLPQQFTDGVKAVDLATRSVITGAESFKATVASVIPEQTAGPLAVQAGLADETGWCPVDPTTFESTLQPDIHVVGDAINGADMPKSASAANSQAMACADAIAAALTGGRPVSPILSNSCYTFLEADDAFVNALTFKPDLERGRIRLVDGVVNKVGESAEVRRRVARAAEDWYASFTRGIFG